jgi:excisionase family DNA binding protein
MAPHSHEPAPTSCVSAPTTVVSLDSALDSWVEKVRKRPHFVATITATCTMINSVLPGQALSEDALTKAIAIALGIVPHDSCRDELLTDIQVAAEAKVSRWAVRDWRRDGKLPAKKIGDRLIRFKRSEVDKFLGLSSVADSSAQ